MNRIAMAVKLRARGSDPLAYCETNDGRRLRASSARGRLASRFTVWGVRGSAPYAGMTETGGIDTNASGELRSFSPSLSSRFTSLVNAILGRGTR